jgi:DNA-binding NtrC family response regulator
LNVLKGSDFDVVITDLQMPGMNGIEFIQQMEQRKVDVQIVMVTAHASVSTAVEAMRHGAFDYIEKPFQADQIEHLVRRALERRALIDRRTQFGVTSEVDLPQMVGDSPIMQSLRERITQVGRTSETVLITGESGTGKELVARLVHQASDRSQAPFVGVNCPVLSAQLMESELFGHERGAFTSADAPRTGRFELADGGTLLLDEITEIDLPLQAKLLRVLQERSFERVGSSETISIDVRVIASTNCDLHREIAEGRFREDLYYRLAVVPLRAPPLRERPGDIELLTDYFLRRAGERMKNEPCRLETSARDLLESYHWPGNIRELQNIISRSCVLQAGENVTADDLRPWLIEGRKIESPTKQVVSSSTVPVGLSLHEMERKLIEATLDRFDGHRAKTADALGIGLRTLSGKLKSYGYAPRQKTLIKTTSGSQP